MMGGAVPAAIIAAFGNGLQGWDNAAIAGSLLFITPEFLLEESPQIVGAIVAASLIGAVVSTFVAGPAADWLGRKSLLVVAAVIYMIGSIIDGWSPSVEVLIPGRGLVGFSIGLIATVAPLFIAECAPPEIRGQLATLPQLMGIAGMLCAYGVVFALTLTEKPNWRLMLGLELVPATFYLALAVFILPESPRWLASKGRMKEARMVLMNLRNTEDVADELSLLVEGLGLTGDASLEEWLLKPVEVGHGEEEHVPSDAGQIRLVGPDPTVVWVAQPLHKEEPKDEEHADEEETNLARSLSAMAHSFHVDQVVSILNEIQAAKEGTAAHEEGPDKEGLEWDPQLVDDNQSRGGGDIEHGSVDDVDARYHLTKPLLGSPRFSRQSSQGERGTPPRQSSQNSSNLLSGLMRALSTNSGPGKSGLGEVGTPGAGGWQLAWQVDAQAEGEVTAGGEEAEESFRTVLVLQENNDYQSLHSSLALPGMSAAGEHEAFKAQVLVTHAPPLGKEYLPDDVCGPATVHPAMTASRGPAWAEVLEPGVTRALVVGVSLQALQQACGINAVLYYTPTILMSSGAEMLEDLGLTAQSSSILASAATTMLMLPCIFIALWLMDRTGRRSLLLYTIPLMTISLALLSFSAALLPAGSTWQSVFSLSGVALFSCSFVTGFGPIPNIICSEIFPTRVRGICIGLCAATMWGCNIAVSEAFPAFQASLGLGGVFGLFGIMTIASWLFVFLRVPETKGLPLEVISEIFAMTARAGKENSREAS